MNPFVCPLMLWAVMLPPEQPPSIARLRFPPQWVCEDSFRIGAAYQQAAWQRSREAECGLRYAEAALWNHAAAEASRRMSAWNCLRMVGAEFEEEKRDPDRFWGKWLESLRGHLSEEEFAEGAVPYPVPIAYVIP